MIYYIIMELNFIKLSNIIKKVENNNNMIYFGCKNYRKDERHRVGLKRFCDSKIEYNINANNGSFNQKFKIVCDHS